MSEISRIKSAGSKKVPGPTGVSPQAVSLPAVKPDQQNAATDDAQQETVPETGVTAFAVIQNKKQETGSSAAPIPAFKPASSQLPASLQKGIESISNFSMQDVQVAYNSDKPAQLQAHAYAQGNTIHVAPGQEKHLPHEAWHVVQQKQGRVKPTVQLKGELINDDKHLEQEADTMGARAASYSDDTLVSGFEELNKQDVSDIRPRASLVNVSQRQELEMINSEITAGRKSFTTAQLQVQQARVAQLMEKHVIVEDGTEPDPLQISKSGLIARLRLEIKKISKEILEPVGLAEENCPDLNYWLTYYQSKDVLYIEQAMARYAPGTAAATDATQYMTSITERVRSGLQGNVRTRNPETVDPEKMPEGAIDTKQAAAPLQLMPAPIQLGASGRTDMVEREVKLDHRLRDADPKQIAAAESKMMEDINPLAQVALLRKLFEAEDWTTLGEQIFNFQSQATKKIAGMGLISRKEDLEREVKANYSKKGKSADQKAAKKELKDRIEVLKKLSGKGDRLLLTDYISDTLAVCTGLAGALSSFVLAKNVETFAPGDDPATSVTTVTCAYAGGGEVKAPAAKVTPEHIQQLLAYLEARPANFFYISIDPMTAGLIGHDFVVVNTGADYDLYESDASTKPRVHMFKGYNKNAVSSQSATRCSGGALGVHIAEALTRCVQKSFKGSIANILFVVRSNPLQPADPDRKKA